MTFRYAKAGTYRCDDCGYKELSQDGDLLPGWTAHVVEVPSTIHDGITDLFTKHKCPRCSQEAAA